MKASVRVTSILFILTTLLLKVSGLLRDMVVAFYFGDSYQADAFLAAFILPNILFLFLNHGMKNTLVPSYLEAADQNRGNSYLTQIFKATALGSIFLGVVGSAVSPYLIPILYSEFSQEAKALAIGVSVILMSSIAFVGMNAVLEAYLDARNKFSFSVLSQIIVVGSTIGAALLFAEVIGPYALAAGYLAGALLSLVLKLAIILPKRIILFREKIKLEEVRSFYLLFFPVALTVMVGQINLAVDNVFASRLEEGAVTYINYAKNLVHFPQAIFGVTIATIVFPMLAKAQIGKDRMLFNKAIEQGLSMMAFIVVPSIAGMMFLMPEIVSFLYERGEFTNQATQMTSQVSYFYVGSVLFFSLTTIINKGFYSLKKGHYILGIGAGSIGLNLFLNYFFIKWLGLAGIPLASSVVGFIYILVSSLLLTKLTGNFFSFYLLREGLKITGTTAFMIFILYVADSYLPDWPAGLKVLFHTGAGCIVYFTISHFIHVQTLKSLTHSFSKKGRVTHENQSPARQIK